MTQSQKSDMMTTIIFGIHQMNKVNPIEARRINETIFPLFIDELYRGDDTEDVTRREIYKAAIKSKK